MKKLSNTMAYSLTTAFNTTDKKFHLKYTRVAFPFVIEFNSNQRNKANEAFFVAFQNYNVNQVENKMYC